MNSETQNIDYISNIISNLAKNKPVSNSFFVEDSLLYDDINEVDSSAKEVEDIINNLNIRIYEKNENIINDNRAIFLNKEITPKFIELIKYENFEFGYKSKSEELLQSQFEINALATRNWLNEIFLNNFQNETILIGILRIIGRFEENLIFPQGQTIALAALLHQNDEIKELGIRAFENWYSKKSIAVLENLDLQEGWLNEYKNEVIKDIKEELCSD